MDKYLFNQTEEPIYIESIGVTLGPCDEYVVSYEMIHIFVENPEIVQLIKEGRVLVGTEGGLIEDPAEGEAFFRTMLGDQVFLADENGENVHRFDNSMVVDEPTGHKAVAFFMNMLTMMRELYNAEDNPVYVPEFQPILGEEGWGEEQASRILSLEAIHGKAGWHRQEIFAYGRQRSQDLLIYYGYLNSFNSAVNQWDNEKVAQDMAKYNLIVLGAGLQHPEHPDYANTQIIIARIKALNPTTKIFGYVSMQAPLEDEFVAIVEGWDILEVHGIFIDEAGYDYGSPETNRRGVMVEKVDIIHSMPFANICFVNAWNMDHIIGLEDDPSYPNETWNRDMEESGLGDNDWYLLESFAVNTLNYSKGEGYATKEDWAARGVKAQNHRITYKINLASVGIINDDNPTGQDLFQFSFVSALMWSLEANGTSSDYYGAGTAQVAYWGRASTSEMGKLWNLSASVQEDKEVFLRYVDHGRFKLDFTPESQVGLIEKY